MRKVVNIIRKCGYDMVQHEVHSLHFELQAVMKLHVRIWLQTEVSWTGTCIHSITKKTTFAVDQIIDASYLKFISIFSQGCSRFLGYLVCSYLLLVSKQNSLNLWSIKTMGVYSAYIKYIPRIIDFELFKAWFYLSSGKGFICFCSALTDKTLSRKSVDLKCLWHLKNIFSQIDFLGFFPCCKRDNHTN